MTYLLKNFSSLKCRSSAQLSAMRNMMIIPKSQWNSCIQRGEASFTWRQLLDQRRSRSTMANPVHPKKILNAIETAKNAARKRSQQPYSDEEIIAMIQKASIDEQNKDTKVDTDNSKVDKIIDTEDEIKTLREFLFEKQEKDDTDEQQRASDIDLYNRISAQKIEIPYAALSLRVIRPYHSYKHLRTSWAEFRRNMIYGKY